MKKWPHLVCVFLLITIFSACEETNLCPEITIPETDTTAPIFTFNIRGPGIGQTLSIPDGWRGGLITLLANSRYNFVYSASDQGGTRLVQMQIPINGVLTLEDLKPERATSRTIGAFSEMLELSNNDEVPTSCLIMSGRFATSDDLTISARIGFGALDYGGASRASNTTTRDLSIQFTEDVSQVGFTDF